MRNGAGFRDAALALGLIALTAACPATAQDSPIEVSGEVVVTAGSADGDGQADADAVIRLKGSHVFAGGIELGAGGAVRADDERPPNIFAGGRYSSLLAGGDRGLGLTTGDVFFEEAYLFARGGFGTVLVGRDDGIAARLAVTSPTIFRSVRVNDWRSDFTGLNDIHTVNDFSGSASKVTYMPPPGLFGGVIGQLQLGLSYAPRLSDCGDRACAPVGGFADPHAITPLLADQAWRDVMEAAVYYRNAVDLSGNPLELGMSASYVRAEEDEGELRIDVPALQLGDYSAYAFGLNLGYRGFTLGGSFKSTNAGILAERDEDYLAFDAGVTYETGKWNFMLGYGAADADRDAGLLVGPATPTPMALDRRTQTAQAGVSKVLGQGVTLGVAAQFVDSDKPDALGGNEEQAAIVLESSIKF